MKLPAHFLCLGAALPTLCSAAVYITGSTGNGNFETVAAGAPAGNFNINTGNSVGWTNWSDYDSQDNNTGVTGGGDRAAYLQPDGGAGAVGPNNGTGGAIRSTLSTADLGGEGSAAGTEFTYGFHNNFGGRGAASMVLLYNNAGVWTEITGSFLRGGPDNSATAPTGTLSRTFTVTAGSAWENQAITVGFRHSLATDDTGVLGDAVNGSENFPEIDDVVFTSVPEPTFFGLLGLSSLVLLSRRRI